MNTIYGELPYELGKDELGGNFKIENKNPINLDNLTRSLNLENEQIRSITTEDLNHLNDSIQASTKIWKEKEEYRDYNIVIHEGENKVEADSGFIKRIREQYANNDSLEGNFMKNEKTQEVLGKLFSKVSSNISKDIIELKRKLENLKKKEKSVNLLNQPTENNGEQVNDLTHSENNGEEKNETVETREEFILREFTEENFERFLCSPKGLKIIEEEYKESMDPKTGEININTAYLSKKLHDAWRISLQDEYEAKYGETDNKFGEIRNVGRKTLGNLNSYIKSFSKGEITEKELVDNFDEIINSDDIKNLLKNSDFKEKIRNSIRIQIKNGYRYMNIKDKYNIISLNSGDSKMDLEIKSYLYLYGKIFFSDIFPKKCGSLKECENDLSQIMEAILVTDGTIKKDKKKHSRNRYLPKEQVIEDKSLEESIRKREELKRRMQEINGKNSYNGRNSHEGRLGLDNDGKSLDLKNASGLEIASSLNLGKKLSKYKINGNESIDEKMEHDIIIEAFQQCFRPFLETSYKEGQQMKSVIDESQMRKIYNFENNTINTSEFEIYKNRLLKQGFDNDDINQIYGNLNRFLGMMNEAISKVGDEAMNKQGKFGERVKTHAVGAIIDNIKAIFSQSGNDKLGSIFEGFQFDNNSPVDIIGNDMLIHGKMNGVKVTISYKLDSGEIYINSFIQKKIVPPKITIGNMEPDYKIGQIDSFDKILDNYYKLPTISNSGSENYKMDKNQRAKMVNDNRLKFQELFGTKLDVIGEMAKYHIEKQGVRNSVIKTFCNTFHMNQEKLEVTEGSNLYDTLDIISNSDTDTLASFSKNMEIFLNYFGLKWGDDNNILDERKSIIFDEDSRVDEGIKDIQGGMMNKIKESMKNFNNEKNKITYNNTGNFDNTYNIGLAGIIKEYMKEGSKPGWKLDITKMEQFLKKFNIGLSELNQKKNELSDLDEKFDEA